MALLAWVTVGIMIRHTNPFFLPFSILHELSWPCASSSSRKATHNYGQQLQILYQIAGDIFDIVVFTLRATNPAPSSGRQMTGLS